MDVAAEAAGGSGSDEVEWAEGLGAGSRGGGASLATFMPWREPLKLGLALRF